MLKKILLNSEQVDCAIKKVAKAIYQDFLKSTNDDYALVGMYKQGVPLMQRLADELKVLSGKNIETAKLDISLYRDDFAQRSALPIIRETIIPFEMDGKNIVLVDDVLSTGRTIRAALDAVNDYGRPGLIKLAVLVDRGGSEYPIHADYIGCKIELPSNHKVALEFDPDGVFEVEWNN